MQKMADAGVRDKVIIHCKEACFVLNVQTGAFTEVSSLKIPGTEIKGSVGAGDAFCAGCLYGIYNHFPDRQLLEFASAAAACSLFAANSVDGMRKRGEIEALSNKYGRLSK
jgi:sugar/nucleoside kinase (ribokinase family)